MGYSRVISILPRDSLLFGPIPSGAKIGLGTLSNSLPNDSKRGSGKVGQRTGKKRGFGQLVTTPITSWNKISGLWIRLNIILCYSKHLKKTSNC